MKRFFEFAACYLLLVFAASTACGQEPVAPVVRLATYEKSTGEIYFALSVAPSEKQRPAESADVVILFDTSASQVGLFREDSFNCLERLLDGLGEADRVQLFALDLKPVPMNAELVSAKNPAIQEAFAKLKKRTPLGSTDLPGGMAAAAAVLDNEREGARAVIYIGDGVSRANFLNAAEMEASLAGLRKVRASVSSFAIGPQRNVELLAAYANHTGGNVAIDSEGSNTAVLAGALLAKTAHGIVWWPRETKLPEPVLASYPETFPPLRMDRDSVVIGLLKQRGQLSIEMVVDGTDGEHKLNWKVDSEPANPEFGFLPKLVEMAAKDGGVRLPTVGSGGLREIGRVILNDAQTLLKLGAQAIKRSDFKAAARAAKSVLDRDPDNPQAHALKRAAERGLRRQNAAAKKDKPAANDKPPEAAKPTAAKPTAAKPTAKQPEAQQPEAKQPEAKQADPGTN